jgi:Tol biopolymer transport system component
MRRLALICAAALLAAVTANGARTAPSPGEAIAVATTRGAILLVDAGGRRLASLVGGTRPEVTNWAPAWSPDGQWLAFARSTDGRRSFHVYVMRADGSGVRQITRGRFDEAPAWSPDGRWIAYVSTGGIRIVHPNGHGSRLVRGTGITAAHYSDIYGSDPSWTPQGRLSYSFHEEIPVDWPASCRVAGAHCGWVFVSDRDGGNRRPILKGRDAHWSADGRLIVFTPSNGGVAIMTGGKRRLLGRGYKANWSADGAHIVYARLGATATGDSVWIMEADGRNAHRIMNAASDPAWRPAAG